MATYATKQWVDTIVQYPTRYKLIHADSSEEIVTLVNEWGVVTESGDVFDAATFNNFEGRIDAGFDTCMETLAGTTDPTGSQGKNGDIYLKTETVDNVTSIVAEYVKISGSWLAVPVGGGGGSTTVYMGTTDPAAVLGESGNLYAKYHTENNAPVVDAFYVKISGSWAAISTSGGAVYIELTQQQYEALSTAEKNNGTMYFVTDAAAVPANRNMYIGTCNTAGTMAQKEVTVSADQNFVLEKGTTIAVFFSNNNSASNVTLSVNNGTAYPIYYSAGVYSGNVSNVCGLKDSYIFYTWDGTNWVWLNMDKYMTYNNMTQAEAEAGTSTNGRLLQPTILKNAIQYHAIPQDDNTERVVGTGPVLGGTLYEKTFSFAYMDMQGGTQDATRINGVFVLDSNVNYDMIYIVDAQIINLQPNSSFNVWSMPLPISSASGLYSRVQVQKSYAEPAAYGGVPFIYFDTTYNASQIFNNQNNFFFVFTVRYTKAAS